MKALRGFLCVVIVLLLSGTGSPVHAQEASPSTTAPAPAQNPVERASDVVGGIGKCRQPGANPLNATCAIELFHEAGDILRDAGVEPEAAPNIWWTIYEGLGTGFAQLGKFDKALSFYKLAGAITKAPPRAREESAYYVGRVQHELGMIDEALHTYDTLFTKNDAWIEQAERDPLLADLRRTEQWQNMMSYYIKLQQREKGASPPASKSGEQSRPSRAP